MKAIEITNEEKSNIFHVERKRKNNEGNEKFVILSYK
jgi:hypothetical protein